MDQIFPLRIFFGRQMLVKHFVKEDALNADGGDYGLIEAGMDDNGLSLRVIGPEPDGALGAISLASPLSPLEMGFNGFIKKTLV